jgi:hypothetical protein
VGHDADIANHFYGYLPGHSLRTILNHKMVNTYFLSVVRGASLLTVIKRQ